MRKMKIPRLSGRVARSDYRVYTATCICAIPLRLATEKRLGNYSSRSLPRAVILLSRGCIDHGPSEDTDYSLNVADSEYSIVSSASLGIPG